MNPYPIVLIIDDEAQIRRLLQLTLESNGFKAIAAGTGADGLRKAATDRPDVILLDLGLPDMDGVEVLRKLREWSSVPVIILSVREAEQDIVTCLDAGANDYLVKPFRTGELLARIRAAARQRLPKDGESVFRQGSLMVDLAARIVKNEGTIVHLTATEYALLALFVRNAGKVLTHKFILQELWGPHLVGETQYLRVYVGQLRKKIEDDPANPRLLITELGVGYRLAVE
jgi:two-component system KDP operon response regulator KdpE